MLISSALEKGDIVMVNLDPVLGHEQSGIRPALVISEFEFNASGLVIICPITSKIKKNPSEVVVTEYSTEEPHGIHGVVLVFQLRTVDKNQRITKVLGKVDRECLNEVMEKISLILGI